jgi:hypothetical protein
LNKHFPILDTNETIKVLIIHELTWVKPIRFITCMGSKDRVSEVPNRKRGLIRRQV